MAVALSMAAGDQGDPSLSGLVTMAMAWRVKCRLESPAGGAAKHRWPIQIRGLGVHPNNRGGVYPSGLRCQSLLQEVMKAGFSKGEVNRAAVVVEEPPYENIRSRGEGCVTGKAYNVAKSGEDEFFAPCFQPPLDDVRYMMWSHNHVDDLARLRERRSLEFAKGRPGGHHVLRRQGMSFDSRSRGQLGRKSIERVDR